MSDSASEFDLDFEAYPSTGTLAIVRESASRLGDASLGDWEQAYKLDRPGLGTDPLTATFTDLDLAPARTTLQPAEPDHSEYWNE
jgi:hypothetical protein